MKIDGETKMEQGCFYTVVLHWGGIYFYPVILVENPSFLIRCK